MGQLNTTGAVILCGGASRRMGTPKALLPFGELTFIEHMVARVSDSLQTVVVVASPDLPLPEFVSGPIVVRDKVAYQGPLMGMMHGFEALTAHQCENAIVVAVDTPLLHPDLLKLLIDRLGANDIVIPYDGQFHYPLHAAYKLSTVLPEIRQLIETKRYRPVFLMERLKFHEMQMEEIQTVDPGMHSFLNCNTPAAYRQILRLAGKPLGDAFTAPKVTLELFGIPRLRAGVAKCEIEAETVEELLQELVRHYPGLQGEVIAGGKLHRAFLLMRGTTEHLSAPETRLEHGDQFILMNMDAGG